MPIPNWKQAQRGCLVILNSSGTEDGTIAFQYNPKDLSRTIKPDYSAKPSNDDGISFQKKAAVQTMNVTWMIQAVDNMWAGEVADDGLIPILAKLETLVNPSVADLSTWETNLKSAIVTVPPLPVISVLLQMGSRQWPVKINSLTLKEKAFDQNLVPIEAEVQADLEVLTYDNVLASSPANGRYETYHKAVEKSAGDYTVPTEF